MYSSEYSYKVRYFAHPILIYTGSAGIDWKDPKDASWKGLQSEIIASRPLLLGALGCGKRVVAAIWTRGPIDYELRVLFARGKIEKQSK